MLYIACGVLGLVAGVIALFVFLSPGETPLEPWHTEDLSEEFTAAKADEVRTFADYRRLEDRLFAQLRDKVYARTGTGPAYTLVRYSNASAADPNRRQPDWNRSFELPAATPAGGVLLLHGMTDAPYTLRALGEALNRHGYHVVGLRLPGHGTAPSGLKTVTREDMAAAVRLAATHLAGRIGGAPLHIVGYSTGGPLAVEYALDARDERVSPAPASLVLISPAVSVTRAAALAAWKTMLARLPGLERLAWTQVLPEFDPYKYNSFTTNAAYLVHRLTRSVANRLREHAASGPIRGFPPTLVFQSAVDATVSTDAIVDNLLKHLAPEGHELVLFDLNRRNVTSSLIIADPGPLTARLMGADALPFALSLVTNENADSTAVVARRKPALSAEAAVKPLDLSWPGDIISLSHIALPFPPDDPLYGRERQADSDLVFLGQIAIKGERGLLLFPADWLLRLRHNPFYPFVEARVVEWFDAVKGPYRRTGE